MRLFLLIFVLPFSTYSQNIVTGNVSDLTSGEYLIGASVIYESSKGTTTDFDGNFRFSTDKKSLTVKISYVGYESLEKKIDFNKLYNERFNSVSYTHLTLPTTPYV